MKEKFRQLKDSLLSKVDRQKMLLEQKRREKEFIRIFQEFTNQISQDLDILNESPQLLNAVELGRAFSEVCDKIGQDDYYKGLFDFLTLVRNKDRELDRRIEDLKYRFEYDNKEKFRVEGLRSVEYVKNILQSLNSFKEDIKREEEDKELTKNQILEDKQRQNDEKLRQKQEGKFSESGFEDDNNPLVKAKTWLKDKLHPEDLPENQEKIAAFRKSMSLEQQEKIKYELSAKDELSILQQFTTEYIGKIKDFEAIGNYKHIKAYVDAFFSFLEGYGDTFLKEKYKMLEYSGIRSEIRGKYKEVEDWMGRVEIKYQIPKNHNPKEPAIEPQEVKLALGRTETLRHNFIRQKEDANILNLLNNKDKNAEKELKEQERAAQKAEQEKKKEQERLEKEHQKVEEEKRKEAERLERERQKAEEEKRKEAERLERERQKAEEEKRKEAERLERERQKAEEEKRKEAERLEREKQKAEEEKRKEAERLEREKQKAEEEKLEEIKPDRAQRENSQPENQKDAKMIDQDQESKE
jgi:hypothetical protein